MLNVVLCKLLRGFASTQWRWTVWMLLVLIPAGSVSSVTVYQPPVLTAALGRDAIVPCELRLSAEEDIDGLPILYWYFSPNFSNKYDRLISSGEEKGRATILDKDQQTSNKSMLLKSVEWGDGGNYQCKLSVKTKAGGSFRANGDPTALMVYDAISFNLSRHNDSLLRCEASVTQNASFALSIQHRGNRLQSVESARNASAQTFVTLSEAAWLQGGGAYACQLTLGTDLIAESVFTSSRPEAGEGEAAEKHDVSSNAVPDGEMHPEPWVLYSALLLVPIVVLLSLLIAMLMRR